MTKTHIDYARPASGPAPAILDRPHRFAIGDLVHHVDDAPGVKPCKVIACTLLNTVENIYVPTYILRPPAGDSMGSDDLLDVLCTRDLETVEEHRSRLRHEADVKEPLVLPKDAHHGTPLRLEVDEEEGDVDIDMECAANVGTGNWRKVLRRTLINLDLEWEGNWRTDDGLYIDSEALEEADREPSDLANALRAAGFHVDVEVL